MVWIAPLSKVYLLLPHLPSLLSHYYLWLIFSSLFLQNKLSFLLIDVLFTIVFYRRIREKIFLFVEKSTSPLYFLSLPLLLLVSFFLLHEDDCFCNCIFLPQVNYIFHVLNIIAFLRQVQAFFKLLSSYFPSTSKDDITINIEQKWFVCFHE